MGSRVSVRPVTDIEEPQGKEMLGCRIGNFQELRRMANGDVTIEQPDEFSALPDRIAIIEWINVEDHTSGGWIDQEQMRSDAEEPFAKIRTVGFVVENNADRISLCMTWGQEDTSGVLNIPRSLIRGIQIVQVSEGMLS